MNKELRRLFQEDPILYSALQAFSGGQIPEGKDYTNFLERLVVFLHARFRMEKKVTTQHIETEVWVDEHKKLTEAHWEKLRDQLRDRIASGTERPGHVSYVVNTPWRTVYIGSPRAWKAKQPAHFFMSSWPVHCEDQLRGIDYTTVKEVVLLSDYDTLPDWPKIHDRLKLFGLDKKVRGWTS